VRVGGVEHVHYLFGVREGPQRRTRRRHRLPAPAIFAILAVLGLAVGGIAYLSRLPGIGNAETRVHSILAEHHGVLSGSTPAKLAEAVVAVEDENFYKNFAIDILDGAGRAALAVLGTSGDPGGSTIPQQLARQLYGGGGGVEGTIEAVALGVKLSLNYTSSQILNMYLNSVYYGNNYWGDVAAARGYFGVSPRSLNWAEATMLAGLPQAPSAYDPKRHLALAKLRQRHVLDQLVDNHILSGSRAAAIFRQPVPLRFGPRRPPNREAE
jgi:membrane peptidoglycan carboxypeptidase